jgi:hypothetical protein
MYRLGHRTAQIIALGPAAEPPTAWLNQPQGRARSTARQAGKRFSCRPWRFEVTPLPMPRVVVVKMIIMVVPSRRYNSGECNYFDSLAALHEK